MHITAGESNLSSEQHPPTTADGTDVLCVMGSKREGGGQERNIS